MQTRRLQAVEQVVKRMHGITLTRKAPNGPKLSDGGWRSQAPNSGQTRPPASVRWSAWLGPRLRSAGRRNSERGTGGGMTGAAAGKGRPERATTPESKPRPRSEREQTWPTKRRETDMTSHTEPRARAPNASKLSDGGWRSQAPNSEQTTSPDSVRWSAWLGPRPRNLDDGTVDVAPAGE